MNNIPRGLRNNNPGNIRINSDVFQGEIIPSKDREFKQFKSMAHGYRAVFKILINYYRIYNLKTLRQMISRWAPENENNTDAYIKQVSSYSGISTDENIDIGNKEVMIKIVAGMSKVENGKLANMADIIAGWDLL